MAGRLSRMALVALGLAGCLAACGGAPRATERPPATSPSSPPQAAATGTSASVTSPTAPEDPEFVGDTRSIAARAVDDTVGRPIGQALVGLASRYLGAPYRAFSLDKGPGERLRLDLTGFDCVLFVEQLLGLVNSRAVSTQSEAVDRFVDHVRRLRYDGSKVAYCHRHHYVSRWAEAAERAGYLVNITPYLPGAATRTLKLNWMSTHPEAYGPMRDPANRACITAQEKELTVRQSYLPLAQLPAALPSLRDGDVFALVTR
ncbi:MAG: N-acetylmuramoyl-L-alanine amidase-like domain-containing protein, partial [Cyanobium sp.]